MESSLNSKKPYQTFYTLPTIIILTQSTLISPDTDSDNDGKTDFEESGGVGDNDGDGLVDDKTDSNGDGLLDIFDPDFGGTLLTIVDSNGDGLPDRLDASEGSGGGCTIAPKGKTPVSTLIYLLIPAIVLWRRLRSIRNS